VLPAPPSQLQWGRWGGEALPGGIAVPLAQAAVDRKVTVGNDSHILYRTENGAPQLVGGLGSYSFALQQSQAQFSAPGVLAPASVKDGTLDINFAAGRFSTRINVFSAPTGAVSVSGASYLRSDGIFFDRSTSGTAIAGATALDGKTAGYFFEKAAAGGTLSGITLWSRP
jgi:hypothetical protein